MKDERRTKADLIAELVLLRSQLASSDTGTADASETTAGPGGAEERDLRIRACECVREALWRMRSVDEITGLLQGIREGLDLLEIPYEECGVNLLDEDADPPIVMHAIDQQGEWTKTELWLPNHPLWHIRRSGEPEYRSDLASDDPYEEYEGMNRGRPERPVRSILDIPFAHGTVAVNSTRPRAFTRQHIDLLQDFARVVEEGFRRLDDPHTVEKQNRQLAATLRRDRAHQLIAKATWAMEGAGDVSCLLEAVAESLQILEIPFYECGINIVDEHREPRVALHARKPDGTWREFESDHGPVEDYWRGGEVVYRRDLRSSDPRGERGTVPPEVRSIVDVPFALGTLAVSSAKPKAFRLRQIAAIQELAVVVEEGFRRLMDLRALERQKQDLELEVTRRQRAQAALQQAQDQLEARVAERTSELTRANERLRLEDARKSAVHAVREAVWQMRGGDDLDDVLAAVRDGLTALQVPFEFLGVNLVRGDGEAQTVEVYGMRPEGSRSADRGLALPESGNTVSGLWRTGEVAYRPDITTDDPLGEAPQLELGQRCLLDVPFSHGTLAVSSTQPDVFSPRDIAVLQTIAEGLSDGFRRIDDLHRLALSNERLRLEGVRKSAAHAVRDAVWQMESHDELQNVLTAARDGLDALDVPYEFCSVSLIEEGDGNPTATYLGWQPKAATGQSGQDTPHSSGQHSAPSTVGLVRMWREGRAVHVPDVRVDDPYGQGPFLAHGQRCLLQIPFSHGILTVSSTRPNVFTDDHVDLLRQMAATLSDGLRRVDDLHRLALSEKRYRTLFDMSGDGLFLLQEGRFVDCNASALVSSGLTRDELLGKTLAELSPPQQPDGRDSGRAAAEKLAALRPGEPQLFEWRHLRQDGTAIDVEVNMCAVELDSGTHVYAAWRDITERKQAETKIRESEARFRAVWENTDYAMGGSTRGEHFLANPAYVELFGYENEDELIGVPVLDLIAPEERDQIVENMQRRAREETVPVSYETRGMRKDGSTFDMEATVSTYELAGERYSVVIIRDITERHRADEVIRASREQLRQLSVHLQSIREEERTRIAREIHDELGQVLTALKMDVSWLQRRFTDGDGDMLEKAEGMNALLDNSISTVQRISSQLRPGLLDELGLGAAIEWLTDDFAERAGIPCHLTVDPPDLSVPPGTTTAIYRICQEALTNVARHAAASSVSVQLVSDDRRADIVVEDDGKGIVAAQVTAPDAFGLMGMRERVEALGGTISIRGAPGRGTRVAAQLPLDKDSVGDDQDSAG